MAIVINDEVMIERDKYNFIVVKKIKTRRKESFGKKCKEFRETKHFFPSLELALNYILLSGLSVKGLKKTLKEIKNTKEEILASIKKAGLDNE